MELQELYGLMDRFAASGLTALEWEKKDGWVCFTPPPRRRSRPMLLRGSR